MKAEAWIYELDQKAAEQVSLVISLSDDQDHLYYWDSNALYEMPVDTAGCWRQVTLGFAMPKIKHKADRLKIFIWDNGTGRILVDDFRIELYGKSD
jgi:hypothetical protein